MTRRVVDLSLPITDGMSTYPAAYHPRVSVRRLGRIEEVGRETHELVLGTHSGTHIDAPSHFILGGSTIDRVDLAALIGPARLLIFPDRPAGSAITADEIRAQLPTTGVQRLLMRTDWSRRWGTAGFYSDQPYLAADACELLLERGIRVFGSDTPSVDDPRQSGPGCAPDSPNHKLLLGSGVSLVEYLTDLDRLRARDLTLVALPLRVVDGDGGPARVLAIEDDQPADP